MNIFLMILLISLLIFVHELGHFIAARMCGIKVSKFGFGLPFGPTLYKKQFGDTTFYIHACLLGGYVSFPDDEKDSGLPEDSPELFKNKTVGQRAIVAVAGVTANVACAIVLVILTAFLWGKLPSNKYEVFVSKIISEKNQSLLSSNMKNNDKIISINGVQITHPMQINFFAKASKIHDGEVKAEIVEKNLEEIKKLNPKINIEGNIPANTKIILPKQKDEEKIVLSRTELFGIKTNKQTNNIYLSTAEKALRDRLINKKIYIADGKTTLKSVAIATADTKHPLFINVLRQDKEITLNKIYTNKEGLIGIEYNYKELFTPTTSIWSGFINSWNYLYSNTETMIWSLGQIFTGKIPMKDLHGIVAITKVGGDVIEQQGLFKGFLLTAIISLNLAIVNLLPIPALDGGHLMFLLIEKIRRKAISEKTLELIGNIGFYLLIFLMIIIVFNDIHGLITKKF